MIREGFDALVCDLDGVVYRGDEPVAGSVDALTRLRDSGVRILYCTNNSRSTIGQYVEKLSGLGIDLAPEDIVTSALVTAEELQRRDYAGKTAIVVGGDGIREALGDVCISVKSDPAVTRSDLVVVGWDPTFTYDALARAATAVRGGAALIATNLDATFPSPDGLLPGAGALVAAVEAASGARAEAMGKPYKPMLDAVERRLKGCKNIVVVGDRADTDLAGATERGWGRVLVLTGVTSAAAASDIEPAPDLMCNDLATFVAETLG